MNPRWTRRVACAAMTLMILTLASRGAAETPRAPGSNTGDGSTPFTGLAQAPEANLFVGAATTSIPIAVPPGRKGLTPQLALAYSSSSGPSPYGYGWDFPLGTIQRCGKHGVLSCSDPTYRNDFVVALPSGTVECTLDPTTHVCQPSVQESFVRIQYTPNQWDVWDKSGLHYVFGVSDEARTGNATGTLFQAGTPCLYTFSWGLSRVEDTNGNYLEVDYVGTNVNPDGVLYPDVIRYGANKYQDATHFFEVDFVWSDEDGFSRPAGDTVVNARGGFPARLTKLLSRIVVRYLPEQRIVRSYRLWYEFQTAAPDHSGRQSFLSAVTVFDGSGFALARGDGLSASTTFLYHQHDTPAEFGFMQQPQAPRLAAAVAGAGRLTVRSNGPVPGIGSHRRTTRDILDMNGDGIPDLVDIDSSCGTTRSWKVYLGHAGGYDLTPIEWDSPDPSFECGVRYVSVSGANHATWYDTVDLTGDGIPDWVDGSSAQWKVYAGYVSSDGTAGGFNSTPILWSAPFQFLRRTYGDSFGSNPDGTTDDQDLIDMNGDGLPDLVDASQGRVWINTGSGFEAGAGTSFTFPFGRLRFVAQQGTELLGLYDINGDGLPDQVRANSTHWDVYPPACPGRRRQGSAPPIGRRAPRGRPAPPPTADAGR